MDAHLGRNGFRADRTEGDGTTPIGVFTMTESFGIKADPGTKLPYRRVGPDDWWVSDKNSPLYNTWQTHVRPLPWDESHSEHLITFGRAYDYAVVIDFNRPDPVPGRGSAIFLHVDTGSPTSGCVSIDEGQLTSIIRWMNPAKHPRIVMGDERWLLRANAAPAVTSGATGGLRQLATPRRILDTRTGVGVRDAPAGPLAGQSTLNVVVAGGDTTVPADAVAVAVNLTLTEQTEPTYLTVYPKPTNASIGPPLASNVNAVPGEHRANLVIVGVGADREMRIYNSGGRAHVVADVVGYVSASEAGRFQPVPPYRILDTRGAKGVPARERLVGRQEIDVPVPFAPAGATAVVVNLTATEPSASTWVAAYRGGTAWPGTSTVNTGAGETSANLAVVPLSASNSIRLQNANGSTHVLVDVQGFVMSTGSRFVAAQTPVRVLDTRSGVGLRGRVAAGELVHVVVPGLPSEATAVAVTITGIDASAETFIEAGSPTGDTSNVNLRAADTRANLAIVALVDGAFSLTNHAGTVDMVVDVSGWFVPG
jgi:hypothetical protein